MEYTKLRPDPEIVVPRLRPAFSSIVETIDTGFRDSQQIIAADAHLGRPFAARFRGVLLTECIVRAARQRLSVHPTPKEDGDAFRHDGVIYVFKKAKNRGDAIASNHRTERQDLLRGMKPRTRKRDLPPQFPFPEGDFVFIVYRPDPTLAYLEEVYVTCPDGYIQNAWVHEFLHEVRGLGGVLPLAAQPAVAAGLAARTEITKKATS